MDLHEQLTEHFRLDEFLVSATADQYGLPNIPEPDDLENMRRYLAPGLEQVRSLFDRAYVLTSVYRSPTVNARVGGVRNSAHSLGFAADGHIAGFSDYQVACRIRDNARKEVLGRPLLWDQLILERGRCVHISFDPRNRMHVLSQHGGPNTRTSPGITP